MRKIGTILVIGAAVLCSAMFATRASAGDTAVCRQGAKDTYKACTAQCKSDFIDAKLTCRNVLPSCGIACLAGREQCFDNVDVIKATGVVAGHCSATMGDSCHVDGDCPTNETCIVDSSLANCSNGTDACEAALQAGRLTCGAPCNGDPTCISCMDPFQLANFI